MEDTPMLAQGLRYNWLEKVRKVNGDEVPVIQKAGPECPVCQPISLDRAIEQSRSGDEPESALNPRYCPKRFTYRARQHRDGWK